MAGFILGTGGGILAAAAVYYTLSQDLHEQTASLRGESSQTLSTTFDPQAPPPAASALVGPSYPREPRFSETLRSRWNHAISRTVDGVRTADWAAAGGVIVESAGTLVNKLGGEAQKVEEKVVDFGRAVKKEGERIVDSVESAKEGDVDRSLKAGQVGGVLKLDERIGAVGGDVRGESYTGGPGGVGQGKEGE